MIRKLLVLLALAGLVFGVASYAPAPAKAICADPPCRPEPGDPTPTPPPAPVVTKITGISPGFAWSGDTLTITGTGFTGASVTINNQPATITSTGSTQLKVVVPQITNAVAGPNTIPVVVTSPTGTASTSFTLSPSLQVGAYSTFGVNAQFGQGMDGSASASATLDRSSGVTVSTLTVHNTQWWLSLNVNMSVVWLDATGKVIGFTTAKTVSAPGVFFSWPSGDSTRSATYTDIVTPSPAIAPFARSAQVLLTRNAEAELQDTLTNAVATGKTIASVISTLAPFFA
jgi:hypothetical protein